MNRPPVVGLFLAAFLSALPFLARTADAQEDEDEKPAYWQDNPNLGLGLFQSVTLSPLPSVRSGLGPRLPSSLAEDGIRVRGNEAWARALSISKPCVLD